MGNAVVKLSEEDSIFNPGNPSIVSDPITVEYDAFLDEMMALLKYPVPYWLEPFLSECKVTEGSSSDEFEVMVVVGGAGLKAFGMNHPDDPTKDLIWTHLKASADRKNRVLLTETYGLRWDGEEVKLQMNARADFSQDPFRIDYFWTMADGTRVADSKVRGALQPLVDQVVSSLSERKVVLKLNVPKTCLACDPIDDDLATYDQFFDGLIYMLKDGNNQKLPVEEVSETKFKISPPDEMKEMVPHLVVKYDKEKGMITQEVMKADGSIRHSVVYFSVTRSPVTLEIWNELDGKRHVGMGLQRLMQKLVDGAMDKIQTSSWGLGLF